MVVRERGESGRLQQARVAVSETVPLPRSSSEKFKDTRKDIEFKMEKSIHSREQIKKESRSPHKRELSPSLKVRTVKSDVPSKRIHVERYDEKSVGSRKIEEKMVLDISVMDYNEQRESVKNIKNEKSDDDASSISSLEGSPKGPSKYSKFDSSPEEEGRKKQSRDHEKVSMSVGSESGAESDVVLRGSEAEEDDDADIYDLTEEQLAHLSPETRATLEAEQQRRLVAQLPIYYPGISGCRNVAEFECLNRIEEGTFGVVYRAKEKKTDEIVALKRLKMEKEKEGFPITSLREINMLLKAGNHPNIVNVKEIVVGSNMDKIYLVMEYVEHDMKSLMDSMHSRQKNFTIGQVKTLLHQLLSGVAHMHDEWILHRDLKTSNLLLSHKGILKIGDFGLAREFGDPLKPYTPIVVTLWYRSPELLLGIKEYSTSVDMWSCGCIFAEFLRLKPLFPGKGELDQINRIFLELGTPNDKIWPGYSDLPGPRKMKFEYHEYNQLIKKFPSTVVDKTGFELLNELLRYDPNKRISAHKSLSHKWFTEEPHPTPPELFPTWPAKSELGKTVVKSPVAKGPPNPKEVHDEKLYRELKVEPPKKEAISGFALKFDAPKFSK